MRYRVYFVNGVRQPTFDSKKNTLYLNIQYIYIREDEKMGR